MSMKSFTSLHSVSTTSKPQVFAMRRNPPSRPYLVSCSSFASGVSTSAAFLAGYSSFFFTRTTVILAKPSLNDGGFNLAAMRRITSSGTTRSRR